MIAYGRFLVLIRSLAAGDLWPSRLVWVPCNTVKAARTIEELLAHDPKLCASIKAQLKAPLKDASAPSTPPVGLCMKPWRTPACRSKPRRAGAPRSTAHAFASRRRNARDAVCVGEVEALCVSQMPTLAIKAACGTRGLLPHQPEQERFPARWCYTRSTRVRGFQTDDMARGARWRNTSGALASGQGVPARPYQTNGIMR
jgi:hypothetical protein